MTVFLRGGLAAQAMWANVQSASGVNWRKREILSLESFAMCI